MQEQTRKGFYIYRVVSAHLGDDLVPGQHEIGVRVVGPRSCGTPFDGVDLFAVSLQVMNAGVLLHTPKLQRKPSM